jgi:asparagine synthase (glutamine-hydrolysing)
MCGLAGRFGPAGLAPAPGWHELADARLAHRGPDESGYFRDGHCELVHRRLALIDLSPTGRQPMPNEDGRVLVVYNGEIYNHLELRAELTRRGHAFRGTSDTEVLVHLYEEDGERLLERLRGIFAFALYDRPRRRLLLARDRFGVKPLYYTRHDGAWTFASELKAITALPGLAPRLDRQACFDFFGLGYVPEPATGFADIHALPPGSWLSVTSEGVRLAVYHRPTAAPDAAQRLDLAAAALERELPRAVARQAVADVPVAALLSGGIDSSLVVAAHRRARDAGAALQTFNVRFPDPDHDETSRAVAVATRYGTDHHVIDVAEQALDPDGVAAVLRHFDQPFADTSCVPMYAVSRAVRDRGIICALSGDGGDESFGGYARFWRANRLARLMSAPAAVRSAVVGAGTVLAPWTRDWGRQVAKAARLAEQGRSSSAALLAGLATYLSEEQKAALVRREALEGLLPTARLFDGYVPAGVTDLDELSRRMTEKSFAVSLPSQMLRKVDMMSMRASIEVRVPLLDEAIVGLGLALPHRLKTDGRTGKLVLRSLADRWLPPRVARGPKHGFSIPLDVMVPAGVHGLLDDVLLGPSARTATVLDRGLVRGWLEEFRRARAGHRGGAISRGGLYQRVFTLLSLELWMRDHGLNWS